MTEERDDVARLFDQIACEQDVIDQPLLALCSCRRFSGPSGNWPRWTHRLFDGLWLGVTPY